MPPTAAAPTGRRKITCSMLSARAELPDRYEATTPGKALSAFKRASNALGVPRRVVELVDYLVGRTKAVDWMGDRVMCWPSNAALCDALDIGRTQIKTLIRVGQELGLFEMRDAADGKRFGHRNAAGVVTIAYGFDLAPLAARRDEFDQIAAAHQERRAEAKRLRAKISAARNRVLSLCDFGLEAVAAGDWEGLGDRVRLLARRRSALDDPRLLAQLLTEIEEMEAGAIEALTPIAVEQDSRQITDVSESVDTDPTGPENRPPLTPTNHPSIPKGNTRADGPNRPGVFDRGAAPRKLSHILNRPGKAAPVESGKRERRRESALRGFVVTPDFILQIAPAFRAWLKNDHPTWRELLDASYLVRSELGISQHAWAQACVVLGQTEAVTTIAAIAARHEAGAVQSPGGLLRRMVELHEAGELRLDRTLFGLADGLRGTPH